MAATDAQRAHHAIDRLRRLFGKDFPVLPKFAIGAYATEFNASLAEQGALTVTDPWRINGWLTQVGRVREGADRFTAAVSAHEALCAPFASGDMKVVQFPHRSGQVWAALPEAWQREGGHGVRSEGRAGRIAATTLQPGPARRIATFSALAPSLSHRPVCARCAGDRTPSRPLRLSCATTGRSSFPIRSRLQRSASISTHRARVRRRPSCSRCRRSWHRTAWSFDDAVDVIHEAFDLAKLRGVRPRDLGGGLGAILPGNFLPHTYTDDLPSVRMLELMREASKEDVLDRSGRCHVDARQGVRGSNLCATNS